jgi:hypothetical protein
VLIIVHGFDIEDPREMYFDIQENLMDKDSPYDATIGYLWPGYSNCQATSESDPPATLKSDPPPIFSLMTTAA